MRTLRTTLPPRLLADLLSGRIVAREGKLSTASSVPAGKIVKAKDISRRRRAVPTSLAAATLRRAVTGKVRLRLGREATARPGDPFVVPKDISER